MNAGDTPARRDVEVSGIGVDFVLQQREEGGFARTVLADETDALAGMYDEVGLIQQYLRTATYGKCTLRGSRQQLLACQ